MIQRGFLSAEERQGLLSQVRRPSGAHGPARRAHAILLLDDGLSAPEVARIMYVDDGTVYQWRRLWTEGGAARLSEFGWKGSSPRLSSADETALVEALTERLFTTTAEVIALVEERFAVRYSRSGMIKLLTRLGFEYRKPKALPRLPSVEAQKAFVEAYERLLNGLDAKDQVVFGDAVHPEYQTRPAHGWIMKGDPVAVTRTTGRQRLNLHGALNLETGACHLVEAEVVNAQTTIALLSRLLTAYPEAGTIHVILDNARYHHAKIVEAWLETDGRRLNLIFLPPYAPNLNAIERLWAVLHRAVTHNKFYPSFNDFANSIRTFFLDTLPTEWNRIRDRVSDTFHIINRDDFRVLT
jgi:transposase